MKTFKSAGVHFNIVNELPPQTQETLLTAVNEYIQYDGDFSRVVNILDYIGGGACGEVYDLGSDYILKINHFGHSASTPDGDILKDLQGVPFIPKVYWYSEDNRFIVVQKIKGVTTGTYRFKSFFFEKSWDYKAFEKLAEKAVKLAYERGWHFNDIHCENCMIDHNGDFWVVDVGLFQPASKPYYFSKDTLIDLKCEGEKIERVYSKEFAKQYAEVI